MNTLMKWTGAILFSLLAHAGATQLFEPNEKPPEQELVAGGEAMEVAVLGNAFEETVLAGDPTEAIEPEEAEPEEVVPEPMEKWAVDLASPISTLLPITHRLLRIIGKLRQIDRFVRILWSPRNQPKIVSMSSALSASVL